MVRRQSIHLLQLLLLVLPCLLPTASRLLEGGSVTSAGLFSDLGVAVLLFFVLWSSPRLLRAALLILWAVFQICSRELLLTMQRMAVWQDVHYLFDPAFMSSTTAGFNFAAPWYAGLFLVVTLLALFVRIPRPSFRLFGAGVLFSLILLGVQFYLAQQQGMLSLAARYNPLHWFVVDGFASLHHQEEGGSLTNTPKSLAKSDLAGKRLLPQGKAKNLLIVVLEGIPGLYFPEIRQKMGVEQPADTMGELGAFLDNAMLTADFVDHSHQTIRGLYAMHCGDFSKLTSETPKGFELLLNPARANMCLPAQMAKKGWETHYLQGAPLKFMNKDKVMPAMGFQQVHGVEWFAGRRVTDFIWGTTDEDFFAGATHYVEKLQARGKPWMLSLLTVGTHQPFAATDEEVKKYGSRKSASVAVLDRAVTGFLQNLRDKGVLEDTLVVITSDESHGSPGADWYSSWGLCAVLAPEAASLPREKEGTYGLVDMEVSVLDYFGIKPPAGVIGRSLFRDYDAGRDMITYTAGKLRWQQAGGKLIECSKNGTCFSADAASIIGPRPSSFSLDPTVDAGELFQMAGQLNRSVMGGEKRVVMEFGSPDPILLPRQVANEWTDNLIGAQYLNFPKDSHVTVDIQVTAESVQPQGVQLRMVLRQYEQEVKEITFPSFALLHSGETDNVRFDFVNQQARGAFSFHLVGGGEDSSIKIEQFQVVVERR